MSFGPSPSASPERELDDRAASARGRDSSGASRLRLDPSRISESARRTAREFGFVDQDDGNNAAPMAMDLDTSPLSQPPIGLAPHAHQQAPRGPLSDGVLVRIDHLAVCVPLLSAESKAIEGDRADLLTIGGLMRRAQQLYTSQTVRLIVARSNRSDVFLLQGRKPVIEGLAYLGRPLNLTDVCSSAFAGSRKRDCFFIHAQMIPCSWSTDCGRNC